MMKPNPRLLVWLSALVLLATWAQQGPSNKASMAGLTLTLQGCVLDEGKLNCTVEVVNTQNKAISVNISPGSVQALTASGWLYQGQASATTLKLAPKGKTTLRLSFQGVNDSSGLFAMIQVGEARFLGVLASGTSRLAAKDGYCFYYTWSGNVLTCHLSVHNDTDTDVRVRLYPKESIVVSDLGATYVGTHWVVGERYNDSPVLDVSIPARTTTRLGVMFNEARFGQQNYLPQKVQVVRFKVSGGFLELRDVPIRYCGAEEKNACNSLNPF